MKATAAANGVASYNRRAQPLPDSPCKPRTETFDSRHL
jgi:hypothetical protein